MSPDLKEGPKPSGCRLLAVAAAVAGLLIAGTIRGVVKSRAS